MIKVKNEHVFPKDGGWMVRHEGMKKTFRFFEIKEDAMEYAGIMAINNGSFVVTHKYNGQFKEFRKGNEIIARIHEKIPRITDIIEIKHPIVNNTQPIVETITPI
ncbi:hypothetical protein COU62_01945 [Candidatus Pacearchaeota archaeon CG10_big_fil_rev_8_21_14_0_10_35_219]|nr:DUF2188 domain-containing protein [Candidatus Pacearchaeota archaeon]OIO42533.1 MAG: hypothetical protein AUJ63_02515 [Candidatus Pacearchaeota archaeon CG1_02_35_32]PIO07954.1 MAG: hypothetical protein COU62_01945 [Candidatus Pacearchaeota archaeon CG10_big_fil_rev_8_21_14_0_10_35_219]PIY81409.1 MAG: hypothetical protein COY79_02755 [Candidatus Pacearchaeota archaeon CG_4_10_14_0_8_um_filter_35_169]PIZ80627.1 MAG: hypothetical protein COY00_00690 [Candidatus Pacearchaeota archaeon CG_4_10_1